MLKIQLQVILFVQVIFSHESPSDTLERQTSVSVSSDTTSLNDMNG